MIELDKSQKQIQKAAWEFARGEFDKDELLELEKAGQFPTRIWKKAADLGFIGLQFDETVSGGGLGVLETVLTAEAFCRQDSSCGMALMLATFSGELIMAAGNPTQKATYLEPLALGKTRCGGAFFEPQKPYDLHHLDTRAVWDGGRWEITGVKTWVANGGDNAFFTVLCEMANGSGGVLFLLDGQTPGITLTPMARKLGNTMTPWADLSLDRVNVGQDQVLGKPGHGGNLVAAFLSQTQVVHAAMAVGIAQGALDRTLAYAKEREQFGRKIAMFQTIRHKIADMALKTELARRMVYGVAWEFDHGNRSESLSAMAMDYACQAAEEVADEAIQIHGGYGYMHEGQVEHFYRDAKFLRLFGSNTDLRRDTIAGAVIGKLS